jgi:hypothetical protein
VLDDQSPKKISVDSMRDMALKEWTLLESKAATASVSRFPLAPTMAIFRQFAGVIFIFTEMRSICSVVKPRVKTCSSVWCKNAA